MSDHNIFVDRIATEQDLPELMALMEQSIRQLLREYLNPASVEASFEIMGVDSQLIEDRTYFVIEAGQQIIGCGGWSRRATLFGGDNSAGRDARLLDPITEPARIRAMYTHPNFTRRGVGRQILTLCEAAARAENFSTVELGATVAGEPLYVACGFTPIEHLEVTTSQGITLPVTRMRKTL